MKVFIIGTICCLLFITFDGSLLASEVEAKRNLSFCKPLSPPFPFIKKRKMNTSKILSDDIIKISECIECIIQQILESRIIVPSDDIDITNVKISDLAAQLWGVELRQFDLVLSKLLYCVQGYALALENERIFVADFTKDVRCYEVTEWLSANKDLAFSEIGLTNDNFLRTLQKRYINTLFRLPKEFLKKLLQRNFTQNGCNQEAISIEIFFRKPDIWAPFIITKLCFAELEEDRDTIIHYIREYISYNCLSCEALKNIRDAFDDILSKQPDVLEKILRGLNMKIKWPHQNPKECLMSFLFFPIQYETYYEIPQGRHLKYALSISAVYSNLVAICEVSEMLACLQDSSEECLDSEREQQDDCSNVEKYFDKKTEELIQKYTKKVLMGDDPSYYFCGILCLAECETEMASVYFKKGYESYKSSERLKKAACYCLYRYLQNQKIDENNEELLENLRKLCPECAKMIEAGLSKNRNERITLYKEAGEGGVPIGYYFAGILCIEGNDEGRAYEYFTLAVQNHVMSAYDNLIQILLKKSKSRPNELQAYLNKAKEAYQAKGELGNSYAFSQLGNLILNEGLHSEANKFFERARQESNSEKEIGKLKYFLSQPCDSNK